MFAALNNWVFWALLVAVFVALTAIFGKVGVSGISSDFATFYRTLVVAALAFLLIVTGQLHWPVTATSGTCLFSPSLVWPQRLSGCAIIAPCRLTGRTGGPRLTN